MFARTLAPAAWAVASLMQLVSCGPTAPHDIFPRTPAAGIDLKSLAPSLSAKAKIYLPDATEFNSLTVRWSNLEVPTPNVVVVPGTENDVAKIVSTPNHGCNNLLQHASVSKYSTNTGPSRSNSLLRRTSLSLRTTATMELLQRWARWITASRSTCLS